MAGSRRRSQAKDEGVFAARGEGRRVVYYWKVKKEKSGLYVSKIQCAMDYVTRYLESYPKYLEAVTDKSWDEIFRFFGIDIKSL